MEINKHLDYASKLHFAKISIIICKLEDDRIDQSLTLSSFFCPDMKLILKTLIILSNCVANCADIKALFSN